jgi:hypothetical protein
MIVMAQQQKTRVAWGLATILAVVVLIGGVALLDSYQRHLPMHKRRVSLLPPSDWGFGRYGYSLMDGTTVVYHEEWSRYGFFMVRVK